MISESIHPELANKLLTPEQAADVLQVSKRTMYEWLRNGEIPSERIGDRLIRIRESDLLSPDARAYFEQGCQLAHNFETLDQAEQSFRKAVSINPRYAVAYFQLGHMFFSWGHYFRAIEPLKKAVELNPTFPACMMLGVSYNNCNGSSYSEAEKVIRQALDLKPDDLNKSYLAQAHYQLGFAILMTTLGVKVRMGEAVDEFRKVLQIEPHYQSAHFIGHILVFYAPNFREALLHADEIEQHFPKESAHIRKWTEIQQLQMRHYSASQ